MGLLQQVSLTLLPYLLSVMAAGSTPSGVVEFCQFNSFEGKCTMHEVILIKTAQYGRMRAGKCIVGEGYIGCKADVMPYLDSLCSGRHNCKVDVTEIRDVAQPCKKDFTSYLEVAYDCVPVSKGKSKVCRQPHDVILPASSGYIATLTTTETGLGTQDCPWVLQATGGQRISLSVFDFSTVYRDDTTKWTHSSYTSVNCPVHLVVLDGDARSRTPLCGGGSRERHLLTSRENRIEMHLSMQMKREIPHFLIEYKVTGCPNIKAPSGAYVTRDGDNAIVRCNVTQETWYITCDGRKWIGDLGNCTGSGWGLGKFFGTRIPVTQGILIAVAIGVALGIVFGSTLLASVLFCRRKCHHTHQHVDQHTDDATERDQSHYPSLLKHGPGTDPRRGTGQRHHSKTGTGTGPSAMMDMADDMCPPDFGAPHGMPYDMQYAPRRSHVYECPNPPKRNDDTGGEPPVYFDLDPEASRYKSSRGKPL